MPLTAPPCAALQVISFHSTLVHIAEVLDSMFDGHPNRLLFTVMIMCPLLMNMIQASDTDLITVAPEHSGWQRMITALTNTFSVQANLFRTCPNRP